MTMSSDGPGSSSRPTSRGDAGDTGDAGGAGGNLNRYLDEILPKAFEVFPPRVNKHANSARRHMNRWVRQYGLACKQAARRRFTQADFGSLAAVTYPTADEPVLCLIADWYAWLFLLYDQFDGEVGQNLEQIKKLMVEMMEVLRGGTGRWRSAARQSGQSEAGDFAVSDALSDLWRRTTLQATPGWRRRFVDHVAESGFAAYWEAENRIRHIVPDEATYIERRRRTGAVYVCMDLVDIVERTDLPAWLYSDMRYQDALRSACNVVCWTNDMYSLEKEHTRSEQHNLVPVMEHTRGLSRAEALDQVVAAIAAEIGRFQAREGQVLAAFPDHAEDLTKNLNGMRSWMRGNLDWSAQTKRYRSDNRAATSRPADHLDSDVAAMPAVLPPGRRHNLGP